MALLDLSGHGCAGRIRRRSRKLEAAMGQVLLYGLAAAVGLYVLAVAGALLAVRRRARRLAAAIEATA
jgi:hypothetical protein